MGNRAKYELDVGDITLRELLDMLCKEFGDDLKSQVFDPKTNKVSNMLRVLVNGRHYTTLAGKLEICLQDGDEIALFPPVVGG